MSLKVCLDQKNIIGDQNKGYTVSYREVLINESKWLLFIDRFFSTDSLCMDAVCLKTS